MKSLRDGKLSLDEMSGGVMTITNLGGIGGVGFTPIVNWPEVAILGIHKIEQRPVVLHGQIVIRDRMYLSLSFDHRVVDGAIGAEFCAYIKQFIENPSLLFL